MDTIKHIINTDKLNEISMILQKGLDAGETYEAVFAFVKSIVPFDSATLFLYNEIENKLEVVLKQGEFIVDLATDVMFSRGKGASSFISKQRKPIILQSLSNTNVGKLNKFKSFLSLPLWIGDKLVGVLNLGSGTPDVYKYEYMDDYDKLALQISLVMDKMNLKKQIERQNALLRETLYQLKTAQDKLVKNERLTAIGEFIVTVNHEINNPLSTIYTNAEILLHLLETKNEDVLRRISERILSAANKISEVTKKLANLNNTKSKEYLDNVKMLSLSDDN